MPRRTKEQRAAYMAQWRARRKAAGICLECPQKAVGGVRCPAHTQTKAKRSKTLYERRKRAGKCVRCGAIPRRSKTLECWDCSLIRGTDQSNRIRGVSRGWSPREKAAPEQPGSMPWLD